MAASTDRVPTGAIPADRELLGRLESDAAHLVNCVGDLECVSGVRRDAIYHTAVLLRRLLREARLSIGGDPEL